MLIKKYKIGYEKTLDKIGKTSIPILNQFNSNTTVSESIKNMIKQEKEQSINDIIDFEKIKINPATDENRTGFTDSIVFRLHFFNNDVQNWDVSSTTINNIGFTDDDVKNSRNRLKKTHLQLSFYDTNDLKTQNLIGYSSVFFDYHSMYEEYINNLSISGIPCEFLIENPLFSSKSNGGFEVYVYKQDASKIDTRSIYMKAEFRNSNDGSTTLFCKTKGLTQSGDTIYDITQKMFFELTFEYNEKLKKFLYSYNGYLPQEYNNLTNALIIDIYQAKAV